MDQVLFVEESTNPAAGFLAQCVFGDKQIDESPCGTGTCARLAIRYARKKLTLNQEFKQLNTNQAGAFYGKIIKQEQMDGYVAVTPVVCCRNVFITGFSKLVIEKNDDLKTGIT